MVDLNTSVTSALAGRHNSSLNVHTYSARDSASFAEIAVKRPSSQLINIVYFAALRIFSSLGAAATSIASFYKRFYGSSQGSSRTSLSSSCGMRSSLHLRDRQLGSSFSLHQDFLSLTLWLALFLRFSISLGSLSSPTLPLSPQKRLAYSSWSCLCLRRLLLSSAFTYNHNSPFKKHSHPLLFSLSSNHSFTAYILRIL